MRLGKPWQSSFASSAATGRTRTIRVRRGAIAGAVMLGMLAVVPAVHALQPANPSSPAGCATSRFGVRFHAGDKTGTPAPSVVPCLTYTFPDYGEANIVQTASGAVMDGGVYETYPNGRGPVGDVARSVDEGSHWQRVPFPGRTSPPETARGPGDPQLWRDPLTNRVFYTTIGINGSNPGFCQTDLSWSADNGATWTNNPDPAFWGCPAFDFPRPFTGPPTTVADKRALSAPGAYPDVLYICKSSHAEPGRQCWKSLDSGKTFTEIGGSPSADNAGNMNAWTADMHGLIYGVANGNLNISSDEGVTWTSHPVPAAFSSSNPEVDDQGNVYLAEPGLSLAPSAPSGLPEVTYSRDQGKTWSTPVVVAVPGVGHVEQVALAVGKPGQIAVSYVGNSDTTDAPDVPPNHRGGPMHGYLTTTDTNLGDNLFSAHPLFTGVQVDSNTDPLLPYGFPNLANTSVTVSRADYIGVTIGPDGQAWAYFYKDLCGTAGVCQSTAPFGWTNNIWTNWMGAVATVGKA